jgi:hypothetical protein
VSPLGAALVIALAPVAWLLSVVVAVALWAAAVVVAVACLLGRVTRPLWGTLPGLQFCGACICFALCAWLRAR